MRFKLMEKSSTHTHTHATGWLLERLIVWSGGSVDSLAVVVSCRLVDSAEAFTKHTHTQARKHSFKGRWDAHWWGMTDEENRREDK